LKILLLAHNYINATTRVTWLHFAMAIMHENVIHKCVTGINSINKSGKGEILKLQSFFALNSMRLRHQQ
jgi:hypothetical protein